MALSLADLRTVRADKPPRTVIYGPEGMGKTSLAAEFPNPVFLQTEEGETGKLELQSFGLLTSFDAVMEAIGALYSDEHGFQTVNLDTTTSMEKLVWAEACRRHKWASIESPGYGKGYKEADYIWQELLDGLAALRRDRGMAINFLAHATVDRFDDPTTSSYSRYQVDLHDRAMAMINRDVDNILLLKQDVTLQKDDQGFGKERKVGQSGSARWIYTEGRPGFQAKNRYGMPEKILFEPGKGYAVLSQYLPQPQAAPAQPAQAA
jgi:hypothetical protein